MNLKINWLAKLPFAVAVVVFALLSYGYFAPQIEGEVLYQHDVKQYEGMTQDILESREATGVDPQWTGSMFGGMPAYLINVAYPAQVIKVAANKVVNSFGTPAAFIFFAMLSMWLMLVMMGFNGWVALLGGLMYGLSTYFFLIIEAGHITKMWALAYAPLMFGGVYMALRSDKWLWGSALAALFASLQISANHPQITYYFGLAIVAFWISELTFALRESRVADFAKRTGALAVAALLALCSNLSPLWYTFEHTPETMRGGSELVESSNGGGLDMDYATAWSYGTVESFNLLVPNFVGGSSFETFSKDGAVAEVLAPYELSYIAEQLPVYWGPQSFTGGPTYIGAVVIFLALLALFLAKGREKWWILSISVIMLLLAWGRHFMWFSELMFNILPGYNKFRTVSMTLVVVEWSLPLLAVIGVAKLWGEEADKSELIKKLKYAAAGLSALLLLFIVAGGALLSFGYDEGFRMLIGAGFPEDLASLVAGAMAEERFQILRVDALRSLLFVVASASVVWLMLKGKIGRLVMVGALMLFTLLDLVPVNRRYLNDDDFVQQREAKIYPMAVDKEIMLDSDLGYRVLNLSVSPFNDATTSYFHRSVGGYHGAKLSRYQDIIDRYFTSDVDYEVLDMLNTRYIISVDENGEQILMVNDQALGAAWFVEAIQAVGSPREEIEALDLYDLSRVAIVDSQFGVSGSGLGTGEISLVEYEPNYLKYQYSSDAPAVAVFSEIYYPKGWRAYVDGQEADYFRANYLLRAMELPAGEHTVEWRFRAPRWSLIEGITLASSLVILLSILILLIRTINERRQKIKA